MKKFSSCPISVISGNSSRMIRLCIGRPCRHSENTQRPPKINHKRNGNLAALKAGFIFISAKISKVKKTMPARMIAGIKYGNIGVPVKISKRSSKAKTNDKKIKRSQKYGMLNSFLNSFVIFVSPLIKPQKIIDVSALAAGLFQNEPPFL